MSGTEPIRPIGTATKIVVNEGESLSVLAQKYNTTISLIKKANNLSSDNIKEGQTLTINVVTDKELQEYQKLKAQYDQKVAAEREKLEIKKRTEKATKLIDQAKKDGYGKDYNFAINEKGNIIIKLKTEKFLDEIREDFNLKKGRLRETNPSIEQKYKPGKGIRKSDGEEYATYDGTKAPAGDTFVIDTEDFKTERTWAQARQDNVVAPVKKFVYKIKFW